MAQDNSGQGKLTMAMLLKSIDRDIVAQHIPMLKATLIEFRAELVAAQTESKHGTESVAAWTERNIVTRADGTKVI